MLSPEAERFLRAVGKSKGPSAADVAAAGESVGALVAAGLVVRTEPTGRRKTVKIELTPAGRAALAALPKTTARAARGAGGARPGKIGIPDLHRLMTEELGALRRTQERILALLEGSGQAVSRGGGTGTTATADLGDTIRRTARDLDTRGRFGGLVPLPDLRRALAALGVSRTALDSTLLAEERAYRIDLKVANDPKQVSEPGEGLRVEGRGLLYYVVAR